MTDDTTSSNEIAPLPGVLRLRGRANLSRVLVPLVVLGGLLLAQILSPYDADLFTQVMLYGIFAMSLDLLIGYTGLPSLGHAAYFGLAAYITAILESRLGVAWPIAVPAGLLGTISAAAVFNTLALRTSKSYYLMITLALSQLLWSLAVSWTDLTGGDNGIPGIERPDVFGISLKGAAAFCTMTLVVFVLSTAFMVVFVRSPVGYALRGIRENEKRMQALGYPVWRYKFLVSIVSAFFAGVAGELFLHLNGFIGPSALSVTVSAQVLMMVLIGAAGTLFGPMIGALVFVLLQYVLSTYIERWLFVIGLVYVLVALFAPLGVLNRVSDLMRRSPKEAP